MKRTRRGSKRRPGSTYVDKSGSAKRAEREQRRLAHQKQVRATKGGIGQYAKPAPLEPNVSDFFTNEGGEYNEDGETSSDHSDDARAPGEGHEEPMEVPDSEFTSITWSDGEDKLEEESQLRCLNILLDAPVEEVVPVEKVEEVVPAEEVAPVDPTVEEIAAQEDLRVEETAPVEEVVEEAALVEDVPMDVAEDSDSGAPSQWYLDSHSDDETVAEDSVAIEPVVEPTKGIINFYSVSSSSN